MSENSPLQLGHEFYSLVFPQGRAEFFAAKEKQAKNIENGNNGNTKNSVGLKGRASSDYLAQSPVPTSSCIPGEKFLR